jgi:hypothetical protein
LLQSHLKYVSYSPALAKSGRGRTCSRNLV